MREFIVVFRSRSEAARYYEQLAMYRISASLINTPSSASSGCGLSVKCLVRNLPIAMQVLERGHYNSVVGRFYVGNDGKCTKF
jgi:hypothetical protein